MVKRTDLSPVIVNDIALRPQNELHRRKLEALRYFMQQLLDSPIRDGIAKVILFGSALEGDVGVESDVDLLVISAKDTASVREACADASLETGFATKESVQPLVYTLAHYLHPRSYFLYQVSRQGREVYTVKEADLKRTAIETLYTLASDYLEGAKETLASGRLRLAVDAGYNA
ncbi:MAG: nucleotidyltransferase domain-containing protein, partial [Anaerolineae bacterium]